MKLKFLFWGCLCMLLGVVQSCNDDVDDLEAQAAQLQQRVTALEEATQQLNENIAGLQYLLNGFSIVGVSPITDGYRVETSDGSQFDLVTGEDVDGLLPLLRIDSNGNWQYSVDGTNYITLTDGDGNPMTALPGATDGDTDVTSPQLQIGTDGYWQVSYDNGQTYTYLTNEAGDKVSALAFIEMGSSSIFSRIVYNEDAGKLVLTLTDGQEYTFSVIETFYLRIVGITHTDTGEPINTTGEPVQQIFPLNKTSKYPVQQSEVKEAVIRAPEGWTVKLGETELDITSPKTNDVEKDQQIQIIITSAENYIRVVNIDVRLLTTEDEGDSQAWSKFVNQTSDNVLLDFSYAGYKHGEVAPPDVSTLGYTVYNITDYGAIPDDNLSDREAFCRMLEAAGATRTTSDSQIRLQKNGATNAIFYFPEGNFILQGEGEANVSLTLTMSDYVIKGAGRDKTSIEMAVTNDPTRPDDMWSCPVMLQLKHNSGLSKLTDVTGDAAQGTFSVQVASTAGINRGDWVCLSLVNNDPELIAQELAPYNATAQMTDLTTNGVQIYDYHQVTKVSGNTITFKEPLMHAVEAKWNWEIQKYPHYENVGVEDLAFVGHAKTDFIHHATAYDDGGFKPINMQRLTNSWMRRVDFESVSEANSIVSSANVSAYDIEIRGNRGHSAIRSQSSSRIFIGAVRDHSSGKEVLGNGDNPNNLGAEMANAGQYHGCGVSNESMGAVIWNVTWGDDACFESHASQPRATLIDNCKGGFMPWREGGADTQLPNHLNDLTIWNMEATVVKYDAAWNNTFIWWDDNNIWWKNLPPIIVGFHGTACNFSTESDQVKYMESNGTAVTPESLYEAQLRQRLGHVPAWLNNLKY